MHRKQAKEFSEGGNACRQMNRPAYSRGSSWGEELGGLQEGVGSEDGGDNLAGGVDSAFAV